ncbi:hypothetical protein E2C01_042704 [Portunus trituberculatus]|uniref:Uncharacterized protein n=1 Tax=Portunus trituberculatus TaxID=210409 RepID=A0A5B7FVI4_PORTR|nr:hypothetical protein [Portunus trituberculatus]
MPAWGKSLWYWLVAQNTDASHYSNRQHLLCNASCSMLSKSSNVPLFLEGNITGDVDINNNSFPRLESSPWKLRVQGDVLLKGNTFASLPRHGLDFTVHHRISLVENNIQHLGPEAFLLIIPQGCLFALIMVLSTRWVAGVAKCRPEKRKIA